MSGIGLAKLYLSPTLTKLNFAFKIAKNVDFKRKVKRALELLPPPNNAIGDKNNNSEKIFSL